MKSTRTEREEANYYRNKAIVRSYLVSNTLPEHYFTNTEHSSSQRALTSATNMAIAGAVAYGGYKLLNVPLTQHTISMFSKYGGDFESFVTKLFPKVTSEVKPGLTIKYSDQGIPLAYSPPTGRPGDEIGRLQDFFSLTGRRIKGKLNNIRPLDVLYEHIRRVEDAAFKVPRTFNISSLMSPLVFGKGEYYMEGRVIKNFAPYLEKMFPEGAGLLTKEALSEHGLLFKAGKLYVGDQLVSRQASVVTHHLRPIGSVHLGAEYQSKISKAILNMAGFADDMLPSEGGGVLNLLPVKKLSIKNILNAGVAALGGKPAQAKALVQGSASIPHAVVHHAIRRYGQLLDNPFNLLSETAPKLLSQEKAGYLNNLLKLPINKFGMGGDYTGSALALLGRHFKTAGPRVLGLAAGYTIIDSFLKKHGEGTILQGGILGLLGQIPKSIDIAYSGVSQALGLTALADKQEEVLGERVGVSNILGYGLAGYMAGTLGAAAYSRMPGIGPGGGLVSHVWRTENLAPKLAQTSTGITKDLANFAMKRNFRLTRPRIAGLAGAGIGIALTAPFILGSLGSRAPVGEVLAEYRGEKEVVLRKGARWEFGMTPYSGTKGMMIAPNWYQRLISRSKEESLYPEEYQYSPIKKFLKGLDDPYWLEKIHYRDRPYPEAGPSQEISQLWANTFGKLFKPPVQMHSEEMVGATGDGSTGQLIASTGKTPDLYSEKLGGAPQEKALSQYGKEYGLNQFGERWMKTKPGLLGYGIAALKKRLTGSDAFYDDKSYLESSSRMTSLSRSFWDAELGGGLLLTEPIRRVLLPRKWQMEYRNPLSNAFADIPWLPDSEEKGYDFKHGDPYTAIPMGEMRLPGAGYASRFPELEGIAAKDYPYIHRYKILADVAPYSDKFKYYRKQMSLRSQSGLLSETEEKLFRNTEDLLSKRKERIQFLESPDNFLADYWGGLKNIGRKLPTEHLTPINPLHKFGGPTDALSAYREELIAPEFRPWDTPIKSFLEPAVRSGVDLITGGGLGVSPEKQKSREIDEYFDKLKYIKSTRLGNLARDSGNWMGAKEYYEQAKQTAFGANPLRPLFKNILALPAAERDYAMAFAQEVNPKRRAEIKKLLPHYISHLVEGQWAREEAHDRISKIETNDAAHAEELRTAWYEMERNEGFTPTAEERKAFLSQQANAEKRKAKSMSIGSFLRNRRLEKYFQDKNLPDKNWIGWHPAVDLDDVKIKVLDNEGEDIHAHNLWESQKRELWRKPYVEQAAGHIEDWDARSASKAAIRQDLTSMLESYGYENLNVFVSDAPGAEYEFDMELLHDRTEDVRSLLKREKVIR